MNGFLWVVQGLLAAAFFMAGAMKVTQTREKLAEQMDWVSDFSDGQMRVIGALEVLGALGLVLPPILDIAPIVAPLAATGLGLLMIGAAAVHRRRGETQMIVINLVLLVLTVIVAWGRFGPEAF